MKEDNVAPISSEDNAVKRVTYTVGIGGNFIGLIDGKMQPCRHWHTKPNGAIRCAKEILKWDDTRSTTNENKPQNQTGESSPPHIESV